MEMNTDWHTERWKYVEVSKPGWSRVISADGHSSRKSCMNHLLDDSQNAGALETVVQADLQLLVHGTA